MGKKGRRPYSSAATGSVKGGANDKKVRAHAPLTVPKASQAFGNFGGLSTASLLALTLSTSSKPSSRKVQRYQPGQRILLVGEGDFTFARALAVTFKDASTIVATALDSLSELTAKYPAISATLGEFKSYGGTILYRVDAQQLSSNAALEKWRQGGDFDRVVFNFPHMGGSQKEDIRSNQKLLGRFFKESLMLIKSGGEVHVTLRDTPFYRQWDIETIARKAGLRMTERTSFEAETFGALGYAPQRTNPAFREAPTSDNAFVHVFCADGAHMDGSSSSSSDDEAVEEMSTLERRKSTRTKKPSDLRKVQTSRSNGGVVTKASRGGKGFKSMGRKNLNATPLKLSKKPSSFRKRR